MDSFLQLWQPILQQETPQELKLPIATKKAEAMSLFQTTLLCWERKMYLYQGLHWFSFIWTLWAARDISKSILQARPLLFTQLLWEMQEKCRSMLCRRQLQKLSHPE
nr:MAG TPA: hypothetical protein [Caudoviricetes sp.]